MDAKNETKDESRRPIIRFTLDLSEDDWKLYRELLDSRAAREDIGSFYNRIFTVGVQNLSMQCTDDEIIRGIKQLQNNEPVSKKMADNLSRSLISYMKGRGNA